MGGFNGENPPPPAPDYPPENAFDITSFMSGAIKAATDAGVIRAGKGIGISAEPGWLIKELLGGIGATGDALGFFFGIIAAIMLPILKALVSATSQPLHVGMEVLGDLTKVYAQEFGSYERSAGARTGAPGHQSVESVAKGMFDNILAPIAQITGSANPATVGSGEQNAGSALGSIISLHLCTWMVNIISNLTGLGALKFINSFDDVILAALSTRSLSRLAMKGYLTKFIGDPLNRDLNVALPLDIGSTGQLIKRYIRGNITGPDLKAALRGKGFDDSVVEDMLLDSAKLLAVDASVYLVRAGKWSEADAIANLRQQGYPAEIAGAVYALAQQELVRTQMKDTASAIVTALGNHQIDPETARHILSQLDFSDDEVQAYMLHGNMLAELPTILTLAQVRALYNASLVDLNFVQDYLAAQGYGERDQDLLTLLYFTRATERSAAKAALENRRRVLDQAKADQAAGLKAERVALLQQLAAQEAGSLSGPF
jgi:hypothetical protein